MAILLLIMPFTLLLINLYLPSPVGNEYAIGVYSSYSCSIGLAAFAGVVVSVAGVVRYLGSVARRRRLGSFTLLLLVGLLLVYNGLGYVVFLTQKPYLVPLTVALQSPLSLHSLRSFFGFPMFNFASVVVSSHDFIAAFVYTPVLIYVLVSGARDLGIRRSSMLRGLVSVPVAALVLLNATNLFTAILLTVRSNAAYCPLRTGLFAGVILIIRLAAALLSLVALSSTAQHAARRRPWGWLVAMLLTLLTMLVVSHAGVHDVGDLAAALSLSASAAALMYGLWAEPVSRANR